MSEPCDVIYDPITGTWTVQIFATLSSGDESWSCEAAYESDSGQDCTGMFTLHLTSFPPCIGSGGSVWGPVPSTIRLSTSPFTDCTADLGGGVATGTMELTVAMTGRSQTNHPVVTGDMALTISMSGTVRMPARETDSGTMPLTIGMTASATYIPMYCLMCPSLPMTICMTVAGITSDSCDCSAMNGDWTLTWNGSSCYWYSPLFTFCGNPNAQWQLQRNEDPSWQLQVVGVGALTPGAWVATGLDCSLPAVLTFETSGNSSCDNLPTSIVIDVCE